MHISATKPLPKAKYPLPALSAAVKKRSLLQYDNKGLPETFLLSKTYLNPCWLLPKYGHPPQLLLFPQHVLSSALEGIVEVLPEVARGVLRSRPEKGFLLGLFQSAPSAEYG